MNEMIHLLSSNTTQRNKYVHLFLHVSINLLITFVHSVIIRIFS